MWTFPASSNHARASPPSTASRSSTPGLVDSGYRGELKVILLNTDPERTFVVEPGMRIAQLVILAVATPQSVEVSELPDSERGEKGFGSSST